VRGNKRDDIIAAATRLFREEGVHATSVAQVITESGSSAGSIYHHFASKDEIVIAVADAALVQPLHGLLEVSEGVLMSPGDMFRAIVATVAGGQLQAALVVQLWAASSTDTALHDLLRGEVLDLRVRLFERVSDWLCSEGLDVGRAETVARLTVGQAMGLLTQRTLDPDFAYDLYVEEAARLLDGLASA